MKKFPNNKELNEANFDNFIKECEVFAVAEFHTLPFPSIRRRATAP